MYIVWQKKKRWIFLFDKQENPSESSVSFYLTNKKTLVGLFEIYFL